MFQPPWASSSGMKCRSTRYSSPFGSAFHASFDDAEPTFAVIEAAAMLRRPTPSQRVRVVNVTDLSILEHGGGHPPRALSRARTATPSSHPTVPFSLSTITATRRGLKACCPAGPNPSRVSVAAYRTATTTPPPPLDTMLRNRREQVPTSPRRRRRPSSGGAVQGNERVSRLDIARKRSAVSRHDLCKGAGVSTSFENGKDPSDACHSTAAPDPQHRDVGGYAD